MKRWLKRWTIVVVSLAVFVVVWAFADAVLYQNQVRTFVRDIEGVPIGAPEAQVQWIRAKYFAFASDEPSFSYNELETRPTMLELCFHHGFPCIVPKDLVLQNFGAYGSLGFKDGHVESKRIRIGVNTSPDTGSWIWIAEAQTTDDRDRTIDWWNDDPNFRVGNSGGCTRISVTPGAIQQRRDAVYRLDFRCTWKWRWCKAATDIVPEAIPLQLRTSRLND